MSKRNKKNVILLATLLVAVGLFVACWGLGFSEKKVIFISKPDSGTECGVGGWVEHVDKENGYSVCYPEELNTVPFFDNTPGSNPYGDLPEPDGGVGFAKLGPGLMGIKVYSGILYFDAGEYIKEMNKTTRRLVEEGAAMIDGHGAIITHKASAAEEFPYEKRVVFVKDGKLFELWTNLYSESYSPEDFWGGFRFIEIE